MEYTFYYNVKDDGKYHLFVGTATVEAMCELKIKIRSSPGFLYERNFAELIDKSKVCDKCLEILNEKLNNKIQTK